MKVNGTKGEKKKKGGGQSLRREQLADPAAAHAGTILLFHPFPSHDLI